MIHIKSTIVLLLVLGLPKLYGTEVPLAILVLPFFLKRILFLSRNLIKELFVFFIVCSTWVIWSIISILIGEAGFKDFFFSLVILIKIILAVIFGFIVFVTLRKSQKSLFYWLLIQTFVIVLSITSIQFYQVLLGFISPRSAVTFSNIYGLRSLGFGLFHVEGAIIYITAFSYLIYSQRNSYITNLQFMISFAVASTIARSAIIPFIIFSIFKKELRVWIALLICGLILSLPFVVDGVFYEALEVIRTIIEDGNVNIKSTQAVTNMYSLPDNELTYLFGDGRFYDPSNSSKFYMSTDVGYMRLLYFGGIPLTLIYILLNLYFCILPVKSRDMLRSHGVDFIFSLSVLMLLVLLIMNLKGIFTVTMFSVVLFLQTKELTQVE